MKEKITNLDILRLIAALSVFAYHSYWDMGCDYGVLNYFFSQSSFFMTLFFVLSGFVLYYNFSDRDFSDINVIKSFLTKRIMSIFPIYYFVNILYLLLQINTTQETEVILDLITFPFQFSLLQCTAYYPYFLNTGLWFFSCVFICYLVFPFLTLVINQLKKGEVLFLMVFLILLCCVVPFVGMKYGANVYSNAFVRIWDFLLGVIVAKLFIYKNKFGNNLIVNLSESMNFFL